MELGQEFTPYKDSFGLVHPEQGKVSGNGIRYTCEYYWAVYNNTVFGAGILATVSSTLQHCEPTPGLLIRHPSMPHEQEGPDDYVARISIPDGFAKRFLEYGRNHGFIYDNLPLKQLGVFASIHTSSGAYLGRQRQIICHAMWAAGEEPDFFLQAWWVAALMQSAFTKEQDGKILGWYLVKVAKGRSKTIDAAIAFWQMKFKKHYPGGVGQVLKEYFGSDEHPSVKYLWGEFG